MGEPKITAMFKAMTDDAARMMIPPPTRWDGEEVERALCPTCEASVIAHVGRLVVAHWAHESRDDCDEWAERDTEWHWNWQCAAPFERREVIMGRHRADVVTAHGAPVELQHSYLSVEDIARREAFYGPRMWWIWDVRAAAQAGRLSIRWQDYRSRRAPNSAGGRSFRWRWPRTTIAACDRPVLLDLGRGELLKVEKFDPDPPAGGWGWLYQEAYVRSVMA